MIEYVHVSGADGHPARLALARAAPNAALSLSHVQKYFKRARSDRHAPRVAGQPRRRAASRRLGGAELQSGGGVREAAPMHAQRGRLVGVRLALGKG